MSNETIMSSYTPSSIDNEFSYYSGKIYNDVCSLGITDLFEREQEYARRMNAIPDILAKKTKAIEHTEPIKKVMKPPTIDFETLEMRKRLTIIDTKQQKADS